MTLNLNVLAPWRVFDRVQVLIRFSLLGGAPAEGLMQPTYGPRAAVLQLGIYTTLPCCVSIVGSFADLKCQQ